MFEMRVQMGAVWSQAEGLSSVQEYSVEQTVSASDESNQTQSRRAKVTTRKERYMGGQTFFRYAIRGTKSEAKRIAETQRKEGYNARVVPRKSGTGRGNIYEVYLRRRV